MAAGVQNMLLAAAALGLGAMWRTGAAAYTGVTRFLGLPDGTHLLSFVYLGYPDMAPPRAHEGDSRPYTTWLGWDE